MKLTIEVGNPSEVEQLLNVLKSMNLESINVTMDKNISSNITEKASQDILKKITRPIKSHLDLELLKKEKNYKGVNRERFNALVKEINVSEPIELLLSQLSR